MNKLQKVVAYGTGISAAVGTLALSAFTAMAAADAAVATTVTSATAGLKENLISGLETAILPIVAVGVIFWAFRFAYKKVMGRAH